MKVVITPKERKKRVHDNELNSVFETLKNKRINENKEILQKYSRDIHKLVHKEQRQG